MIMVSNDNDHLIRWPDTYFENVHFTKSQKPKWKLSRAKFQRA